MFQRDYDQDPFIVIWELTRACALKCLHCRADAQYYRDPRELTFEQGKKLIDDIYEMNNPMLVFTEETHWNEKTFLTLQSML